MIRIPAILAAIILLCTAPLAAAHKPSDSYLTLSTTPTAVTGQWDIALRDLELAVGLDGDGNGEITWGEVRAREQQIDRYALDRLAVTRDGRRCDFVPRGLEVDSHTDGAYAVLRFDAACGGADAFTVDYSLLFEIDPQHRGLVRVMTAQGTQNSVLSPQNSRQVFGGPGGSRWKQFATFVADGIKHIAIGADHILFLVALLLPAVMVRDGWTWRPAASIGVTARHVFGIVTAFTVAHSITLSAAALQIVQVPSRWVESLIALSVVLTALDNGVPFLPRRRWQVAFVFGLLHGLGFASVLLDLGLPAGALAISLFGFNVGVEIGQLVLVALLLPAAYAFRARAAYPRWALGLGSAAIAFVAMGWLIERSLALSFMPF